MAQSPKGAFFSLFQVWWFSQQSVVSLTWKFVWIWWHSWCPRLLFLVLALFGKKSMGMVSRSKYSANEALLWFHILLVKPEKSQGKHQKWSYGNLPSNVDQEAGSQLKMRLCGFCNLALYQGERSRPEGSHMLLWKPALTCSQGGSFTADITVM